MYTFKLYPTLGILFFKTKIAFSLMKKYSKITANISYNILLRNNIVNRWKQISCIVHKPERWKWTCVVNRVAVSLWEKKWNSVSLKQINLIFLLSLEHQTLFLKNLLYYLMFSICSGTDVIIKTVCRTEAVIQSKMAHSK